MKRFKLWLAKKKRQRIINEWNDGFDWCCGVLLRAEKTTDEVDVYIYGGSDKYTSPFDDGARTAMQLLVSRKALNEHQ